MKNLNKLGLAVILLLLTIVSTIFEIRSLIAPGVVSSLFASAGLVAVILGVSGAVTALIPAVEITRQWLHNAIGLIGFISAFVALFGLVAFHSVGGSWFRVVDDQIVAQENNWSLYIPWSRQVVVLYGDGTPEAHGATQSCEGIETNEWTDHVELRVQGGTLRVTGRVIVHLDMIRLPCPLQDVKLFRSVQSVRSLANKYFRLAAVEVTRRHEQDQPWKYIPEAKNELTPNNFGREDEYLGFCQKQWQAASLQREVWKAAELELEKHHTTVEALNVEFLPR